MLNFNRQIERYCSVKRVSFPSEREDGLQQSFKLNSAPATAETRNLKGRTLKVNDTRCWA